MTADRVDSWLDLSHAQLQLLTREDAEYVRTAYADAVERRPPGFNLGSEIRQVQILERLGICGANVRAALDVLGPPEAASDSAGRPRPLVILSTGHRVDAPERHKPRFPADRESSARAAIESAIRRCVGDQPRDTVGIAGLASGNDILFHELCAELGIRTLAVLPIPKDAYVRHSVQDGGQRWVDRFNRLCQRVELRVLSHSDGLPPWAGGRPDYSVFQRGNLWALEHALSQGDADVALIALWNGEQGDGPGGTADMVEAAKACGARVEVLHTPEVFGLTR